MLAETNICRHDKDVSFPLTNPKSRPFHEVTSTANAALLTVTLPNPTTVTRDAPIPILGGQYHFTQSAVTFKSQWTHNLFFSVVICYIHDSQGCNLFHFILCVALSGQGLTATSKRKLSISDVLYTATVCGWWGSVWAEIYSIPTSKGGASQTCRITLCVCVEGEAPSEQRFISMSEGWALRTQCTSLPWATHFEYNITNTTVRKKHQG